MHCIIDVYLRNYYLYHLTICAVLLTTQHTTPPPPPPPLQTHLKMHLVQQRVLLRVLLLLLLYCLYYVYYSKAHYFVPLRGGELFTVPRPTPLVCFDCCIDILFTFGSSYEKKRRM